MAVKPPVTGARRKPGDIDPVLPRVWKGRGMSPSTLYMRGTGRRRFRAVPTIVSVARAFAWGSKCLPARVQGDCHTARVGEPFYA